MKKLNLFVVHTPFQAFISNHLVSTAEEFRQRCDNWVVSTVPLSSYRVNANAWTKAQVLEPFLPHHYNRQNLERSVAVSREIVEKSRPYEAVELFFANIDHPLINYTYKGLARVHGDSFRCACIPEGMLTVMPEIPSWRVTTYRLMYQLLSRVWRVPLLWPGVDYSGLQQGHRIFYLVPPAVPCRGTRIAVPPLPMADDGVQSNVAYVLGTPLTSYLREEELRSIIGDLVRLATESGADRIYYKPHHREEASRVSIAASMGVSILRDPQPIEILFASSPACAVLSLMSSALLNIKWMYQERVRCVVYRPSLFFRHINRNPKNLTRVRELFVRNGVEWVEP